METFDDIRVPREILTGEPRVEVFGRGEHVGEQEVQQRPQLVQVVLQRCSCYEKTVLGFDLADHLRQLEN